MDTVNVPLTDLEVRITDEKGKLLTSLLDDSALNKTTITCTPSSAGKLKVECLVRGQPIDGSPLPIIVLPAPFAKVTKFPKEVVAGKSVYFGLDTNVTEYTAEVEGFSVSITEASGAQIPFLLKDGKVKFTPKSEGRVTFLVTVDGKPISGTTLLPSILLSVLPISFWVLCDLLRPILLRLIDRQVAHLI